MDRNRDRINRGITPQAGLEVGYKDKLAATQIVEQSLTAQQINVRQQLDVLRRTRASRGGVGPDLVVPLRLQADHTPEAVTPTTPRVRAR